MKKLLVAIAAVLISASAYAQLTPAVQFNNRITGVVDAPISRPGGAGAGAGYTAELVLVSGANQTVLGSTTFRTTSAAAEFYVNAVDVAVPGSTAGQQVSLLVRAYETAAGSYAAANIKGQSGTITVTLNDPTLPAAALAGLQGFTMVPEPSTIALGVLGAAALLLRRRK